jgi:uncharacterized protein
MWSIFRHLREDIGFHEVGFAPVTESGEQAYSLGEEGMVTVLEQFHQLADEWLDYALKGRMHGFSNVSETIGELVQGTNKSHPCGRVWACWASRLRVICRPAIALPMPTAM